MSKSFFTWQFDYLVGSPRLVKYFRVKCPAEIIARSQRLRLLAMCYRRTLRTCSSSHPTISGGSPSIFSPCSSIRASVVHPSVNLSVHPSVRLSIRRRKYVHGNFTENVRKIYENRFNVKTPPLGTESCFV